MTDIKFIGTNQVELINSLSGTTITPTTSGGDFIEFNVNENTLSKNDKDYYHFVIPSTVNSTVTISGVIGDVTTKHQYVNLFKDCYQITDASQLQLTGEIMREFCYSNMFLNCTGLTTPPSALPACNLDAWCYAGMFAGCTALTSAPQLPAVTLAKYCYYAMFYNCKNLDYAPWLPGDVKEFSYTSMFYGCDRLGTSSGSFVIDAPDLLEGSCANMFVNCKNLHKIELRATAWDETPNSSAHCNATNMWTKDVASTGFFGTTYQMPVIYGEDNIPENWQIGRNPPVIFKAVGGNAHISLDKVGNPDQCDFRICRNKYSHSETLGAVSSYTPGTIITLHDQDILTFRNNKPWLNKNSSNYYKFNITKYSGDGNVIVSGRLDSLSRGDASSRAAYYKLFHGCNNIVDASNLYLPNSTIGDYAFNQMFSGCTALTAAPNLLGRTALTNYCYTNMFAGCTALSTFNQTLPATNLTSGCYWGMFKDCTNLRNIPTGLLPATTLAPSCYFSMFSGCTNLPYAPSLPATNLVDKCYYRMFENCSKLSAFNVAFTTWSFDSEWWVVNVAPTGIFIKPTNLPIDHAIEAIPSNWAVLVKSGDWLYYQEAYGSHAANTRYTGPNPYGYNT